MPQLKILPYWPDSQVYADCLHDLPWFIWLDSGGHVNSRYDILTALPYQTLTTWGNCTEWQQQGQLQQSAADPFDLLQMVLGEPISPVVDLPFCGGAMGYWGYDLSQRLARSQRQVKSPDPLPDMAIGIYDWAVVVDHQQQQTWWVQQDRAPQQAEMLATLYQQLSCAYPRTAPVLPLLRLRTPLRANLSASAYRSQFARIQHYIREGDCYQVNFAQRFHAPVTGLAWATYLQLRQRSPAPYGAWLSLPWGNVLSNSPEQFLHIDATGAVNTQPIKGTRPRSSDTKQDIALTIELLNSAKDRAENVMIVDLLRNDLSKSCALHSVQVPFLCELHSFATVHHLVSTVTGQLKPDCSALDALKACFPGGSITGAPKVRAMEIIEELEPHRRGLYCGSIGYVSFDGQSTTNIAIRTLVHQRQQVRFWAGGGIVADSEPTVEYQETFDKAAAFFQILGVCNSY